MFVQSLHTICIHFIYSYCIIFALQGQCRTCTDTMSNRVQFKSRAGAMQIIIQATYRNLQWQMHEKKQHIIIRRRRREQNTKDCDV